MPQHAGYCSFEAACHFLKKNLHKFFAFLKAVIRIEQTPHCRGRNLYGSAAIRTRLFDHVIQQRFGKALSAVCFAGIHAG